MFFPEGRIRVFLCRVPVDLRKSFDGLSALVRNTLAQDPLSGHCFVFVNRRATQIRVLYWDRTGYSSGPSAWSVGASGTGTSHQRLSWIGRT